MLFVCLATHYHDVMLHYLVNNKYALFVFITACKLHLLSEELWMLFTLRLIFIFIPSITCNLQTWTQEKITYIPNIYNKAIFTLSSRTVTVFSARIESDRGERTCNGTNTKTYLSSTLITCLLTNVNKTNITDVQKAMKYEFVPVSFEEKK